MEPTDSNIFFKRLSFGFYTLVAALLLLSIISLLALRSVVQSQHVLTSDHGADLLNIQKLHILVEKKVSRSRAYLLTYEDRYLEEMKMVRTNFMDLVEETKPGIRSERTKKLFQDVTKAEQDHNKVLEAVIDLAHSKSSREEILHFWEKEVRPQRIKLDKALVDLSSHKEKIYDTAISSSRSAAQFSTKSMAMLSLIAVILSFILMGLIRRSLRHLKQSESKLKGATKQLTEAIRMRDEFLSIASHELKTPLTSMKLQTQMYKRMIQNQDQRAMDSGRLRNYIEQIDQQILRVTRLINDMLDVSKIRTGKLILQKEVTNLCDLTNEVINRLRDQFQYELSPVPEVKRCDEAKGLWDSMRIEQVINNLLTNALKYGRKKPVEVIITSDPKYVWLNISDQGMGISKDASERIFNRFERSINASEVSGLGLGLYISRQIVEAHGGRIWVESVENLGSTFTVELPKE